MAQNRFYSSLTKRTTTTVDPGTSGATLTVADTSSFSVLDSTFPYTLLVSWGSADQEIVTATARPSSTTFTVTRAQDGTTGVAHPIGATVDHGVSARDYNEAGAHVGASAGVHGVTGSVVGTTDTQVLANKSTSDSFSVGGNLSVAGIGKTLFATKSANVSVTSNTTLTDDPDLQVTLAANATYLMTSILKYEADAAGDFAMQFLGPVSATVVGSVVALISTATADTNIYIVGYAMSDLHAAGGRGAGNPRSMQFVGSLTTGSTAGVVKLQWAQFASSAVATILYAGSWMAFQRVA